MEVAISVSGLFYHYAAMMHVGRLSGDRGRASADVLRVKIHFALCIFSDNGAKWFLGIRMDVGEENRSLR